MSQVSRQKLTKKDVDQVGRRSIMYQTGFNFEKMQAGAFSYCIIPALEKIYGKNSPEVGNAISTYGLDFINTEQHVAAFLMGLVISMEENGNDRALIKNLKTGLFGPLAGLGDAIVWFTLLPLTASICASLSMEGNALGPILFVAFWAFMAYVKILLNRIGYTMGTKAIAMITQNAKALTKAAGILGVMVVGAMVPIYVSCSFSEELMLFNTVGVQSIFDSIIPNLLPAMMVGLIYYLFKKKNINIIVLILCVILFSILMAFLGWM